MKKTVNVVASLRSACAAGLPQRPQSKVIMASVWRRLCQPKISM
ncbi:hypothetical protein [Nocardia sp. NPDC050412]